MAVTLVAAAGVMVAALTLLALLAFVANRVLPERWVKERHDIALVAFFLAPVVFILAATPAPPKPQEVEAAATQAGEAAPETARPSSRQAAEPSPVREPSRWSRSERPNPPQAIAEPQTVVVTRREPAPRPRVLAAPRPAPAPQADRTERAAPDVEAGPTAERVGEQPAQVSTPAEGSTGEPPAWRRALQSTWMAGVLLGVWALGAIVCGVRLAADLRALMALKAQSEPEPVPADVELSRSVDIRRSSAIAAPMLAGYSRPAILVPQDFEVSPTARPILEHEIAHQVRRDHWCALAMRLVTAVFWWALPLQVLARHINQTRETLCDERAAAITGAPTQLAHALLDVAARRARTPELGLAAAPSQSALAGRVRYLARTKGRRVRPARFRLVVLAPALATPVLAMTPQVGATRSDHAADDAVRFVAPSGAERSMHAQSKLWSEPLSPNLVDQIASVRTSSVELWSIGHAQALAHTTAASTAARHTRGRVNRSVAATLGDSERRRLRQYGVTVADVEAFRAAGLDDISVDGAIEAAIHGVTPEYARAIVGLDFPELCVEALIELRSLGVSADYIKQFRELGYSGLTLDEVAAYHRHGVELRDLRLAPHDPP